MFFKFVATTAGDLSAGTLYAAKVDAQNADDSFDLSWVELATATDAQVKTWIDEYNVGGAKAGTYITQAEIDAWAAGTAADDRAAFLESRKAAVAKGATGEFEKMEGVLANPEGTVLYMAMSSIRKGMSDTTGDIQVAENQCGIVYKMDLAATTYDVVKMEPWLVGGPYNAELGLCNINNISNPDNLFPLANGITLVGEDSGKHVNNALWVAKPCTGAACEVAPVMYTNPAEDVQSNNTETEEPNSYAAAAITFGIASAILLIAFGVVLYM